MSDPAPLGGGVNDWLDWQLALHPIEMEFGLERVAAVARRLNILPASARTVVIAGTNGKGSCAALIESLLADTSRVGTYTSPHLWRYNERIRIDGACIDDERLCKAFAAVEAARGETSLTYFEYGTLAALWLFARERVDFSVLEVGLGGRLDAVNVVDADVTLITNIGLDHLDWLGDDRESIGVEKAGVMRWRRPAICSDRAMPASIGAEADRIGAQLAVIGRDFDISSESDGWRWRHGDDELFVEAVPGVVPENLAAALSVVRALTGVPDRARVMRACLDQTSLPGRRERVDEAVPIIYDVGHNAEAIAVLAADLASQPVSGYTHLVLGMLTDKPVESVGSQLGSLAQRHYLAGLDGFSARGLSSEALAERLGWDAPTYSHPRFALEAARRAARPGDRIVVCGSFLTVAHARRPIPT